ncbi:NADH-quinone oxidoreductase subunit NuoH [Calderihabitans maritimus]|uniref:NADH-quinone oxidoreductase subunit H n=1 Tax=Calderihabitans maritimus TaxID=1246530 RepID=A0A1Z5HXC0_9FIRM|nr:NADH-quinone oxidoreductase subunit NuoH [Calderihabitans maritimus]GAW94176.1 NADH dehydrogenase (quinone) [Calderihabitans maritimus]
MWEFFYAPDQWAYGIYKAVETWGQSVGIPVSLIQLLLLIPVAVILLAFIFLNVMFLTWMERKVAGHIQVRYGPMRTGWHGLMQPVADAVKLLFKEPIALPGVDRFIYFLSPMFMFTMAMMVFIVIPFSPGWVVASLDYGLLFIFAVSGMSSFFVLAGGWCSNNKWSLLGAMRTVAQVIGYEVPLILSALGVALLAGSLNLTDIVASQKGMWNIVKQPLGFILFLMASLAEANRGPFDLEEAEQELVGGYLTEYSGMPFAMFYLGEYTHLLASGAIITTLFLGGWQGPLLPPIIWFLIKCYAVIFIFMWIRWTYPRIRVDHLLQFNWKFVLPLALVNLGITSLVLVL